MAGTQSGRPNLAGCISRAGGPGCGARCATNAETFGHRNHLPGREEKSLTRFLLMASDKEEQLYWIGSDRICRGPDLRRYRLRA